MNSAHKSQSPLMAAATFQLSCCGAAQQEQWKSSRSKDSLWKDFFRDPSKWWDNRYTKPSPKHPDFKHKTTGEPLWMSAWSNPSWVLAELRSRGLLAEPSPSAISTAQIASYVASLRVCGHKKDLVSGTSIHQALVQRQLLQQCSDALVTMYAKCGELGKAKALLDMHKSKDVITWTTLIASHVHEGQGRSALDCLEQMRLEGVPPDAVTYVCALKACGIIRAADKGKQIHDEIAKQGMLHNHIVLGGALVDMYAKCGAPSQARQVLEELPSRNVVVWSALISGYVQNGEGEQALSCLEEMQHEGILPNAVTYICALNACASIKAAERGKQIHDEIVRQGLLQDDIVLGGALVDMYAKCGNVAEARQVLKEISSQDVVSWNALIAGYVQEGEADQALDCLQQMQREGILPNAVTYLCILKACAMIRDAKRGKEIHDEIARQGLLQNDILLGNGLVDMYAKCGDVLEARWVLEELPSRDVVSWNALIAGYALKGEAEQALNCFEEMQHDGILPDLVSCACVIKVCSHRGLVEEGQRVFVNMSARYGLKPNLECYNCMIDLFGRAGHLEKAVRLIQGMPSSDHTAIWHALLGACLNRAEVNVGEWAFKQAVKLNKSDGPVYVHMANIYAAAGMGKKAKSIEAMRIASNAL